MDLGFYSFPGGLEPVGEEALPPWAKPWRYDPIVRHQRKLDRRDYKQFMEEEGLSDESSDPMDSSLSSLSVSTLPTLPLSDSDDWPDAWRMDSVDEDSGDQILVDPGGALPHTFLSTRHPIP